MPIVGAAKSKAMQSSRQTILARLYARLPKITVGKINRTSQNSNATALLTAHVWLRLFYWYEYNTSFYPATAVPVPIARVVTVVSLE